MERAMERANRRKRGRGLRTRSNSEVLVERVGQRVCMCTVKNFSSFHSSTMRMKSGVWTGVQAFVGAPRTRAL